jgi:[ribosomal protein S18]-alanine N-acetyltransferase
MTRGPSNVEIHTLEESDLDAVIGIAETLAEAPHWARGRYADLLRADSSRPRIALVAQNSASREVLGFAVASLTPSLIPAEAELESIAVAAPAQRCGIGRLLLASLVTRLRTVGTAELHLEVRASNFAAICFYQAQNFKQTGVRPRYYTDPEEDAILMALGLG